MNLLSEGGVFYYMKQFKKLLADAVVYYFCAVNVSGVVTLMYYSVSNLMKGSHPK